MADNDDQKEAPYLVAVTLAIENVNAQIRGHERKAKAVVAAVIVACTVLFATGVFLLSKENDRAISVLSDYHAAVDKLVAMSGASAPGSAISGQIAQLKPHAEAVAEHAKGAGGAYYNSLLVLGFAAFALIFGVLMSIYRHHLVEISKLQHYKSAFARTRVAMQSALDERLMLVQSALLDRAFEYRSGKEKQVESAVPGHPTMDALAVVVDKLDKLTETLSQSKPKVA
jgi:hypothetical protein